MRDYTIFIPEYIAAGSAVGIIGIELFWPKFRKDWLAYITAIAALGWLVSGLFFIGKDPNSFQGLIRSDDFTTYFRLLAASIVIVVALMSATHMRTRTKTVAEYYGLLLVAGCGMVYMAAATELLTAYIALELLSFSLYILVGYLKRDNLSSEASLKYILLGAFSSAMFLYGMSLIYGVTGTTYYEGIAEGLTARGSGTDPAVIVGMMLILAGVGFKVSAAPFHMWAPDAYEGAPLPITAFLSTASKAAGFALILRLFTGALIVDAAEWRWAVAVLAAVTMTLGNLVAIQQSNLKRLVAYSSIGQVGYMLITIAAIGYGDAKVGQDASSALLLHIAGYVLATLALFAALTAAYNRTGREDIPGLRGLAETQPFLALVITIALFSFAGLPPFAGFATKLFMFQGATTDELLWLVGLAVLNSFISLYYYLMIIRQMYLFDPVGDISRWKVSPVLWCLAAVLMVGVLFIGVYPGPAFELTERAAQPLFEAAGLGSFQVQQP
ncbi:MAG: NADH-quinone oxidoreductase subunit N [Chloroflexi bacterium]|nr:NADH-quinone oxidoreductase subunit N [Dehalococcoidia bacterium]MCO5201984.1 NADH-quinone oxidoreductase subunit N [Chloroflexota bacterium]NJD63927.1 NADH-quinone oxidoreductase subunit N [Chloroflexota bacterium]PWB69329.1 MAG: NADH-quinone oxidoreductase subunit N [Holophagae bacterium]